MQKEEIQKLIMHAVEEDQDLEGLLVYKLKEGEIIASTFPEEYDRRTIEISQIFYDTEQRAAAIEASATGTNWLLKSLARKVVYDVHIRDGVYLFGQTRITEAPSAALEDGLELALMIGRLL